MSFVCMCLYLSAFMLEASGRSCNLAMIFERLFKVGGVEASMVFTDKVNGDGIMADDDMYTMFPKRLYCKSFKIIHEQ